MTEEQIISNSTDYLQKFSYRSFEGELEPRWKRILYLIRFEVTSTWRKSKFGKILMIMILMLNFLTIMLASGIAELGDGGFMRDALNGFIASYLSLGETFILSSSEGTSFNINVNIGVLLIAVFGIGGSAFFADDKFGKVIELYLSRLQKREYVIGKIGAILIYINIFLMLPLLAMGVLYIQALGENHLEYLDFYGGIISYSLLTSMILGLFILALSISVEKRSYAALVFFLVFLFGSIIGLSVAAENLDNEFLLLVSPSNFLELLAYVCLGDFSLGIYAPTDLNPENIILLHLDNGKGLEYWHVLIIAFLIIIVLSLYLAIRIHKMTTEEL